MSPKQLLIVEKQQYNSCSLYLYIAQNRTFLLTNLGNVNTKSCLRNLTHLCIHFLVLLIPSCSLTRCFWGILLNETCNSFKNWPLNLWWISNKIIMEVGNIRKAATFKSFLHLSYKITLFLWQCFLIFFMRKKWTDDF